MLTATSKQRRDDRMKTPDWQTLEFPKGVLHEPSPQDNRLILWLPGSRAGGFQHWERLASAAGPPIQAGPGLAGTAVTLLPLRQRLVGMFGRLVERFRGAGSDRTWMLPSGAWAEQCGERQTDLMLVWAEDETTPLDETVIHSRWPDSPRTQRLGKNLFLISGVAVPAAPPAPVTAPLPQGNPQQEAEQMLAAARQGGDRRKEVAALTDLGIVCLRGGDPRRAVALLEEARGIADGLGEPARLNDVLDNLALAVLALGQAGRALELLEQVRVWAHEAGNRFQEKITLEHMGMAFWTLRDQGRTFTAFNQALALAREVGDRQHEADLLWYLAILHAERSQRDQALTQAQSAIELYQKLGSPHVAWFTDHLQRFREGDAARLGPAGEPGQVAQPEGFYGGFNITTAGPVQPAAAPTAGPGLLRMAISAVKSMSKFVSSGMKTVSASTLQQRLQTCATCEHHTGVRCKLCGCFTSVKARMPHEHCPIEKWPG
jgi:tetratricopeptide (TPR) repeat protein